MAKMSRRPVDSEQIEVKRVKGVPPQRLAFSAGGMVSTAHHRATDLAARVLDDGGNAIDAAVTAALALGVCELQASGLGGQTMMLIHTTEPRQTIALDGSSRAPNRATPETLSDSQRRRGYAAATVPSTPAVLSYALHHYGTMTWDRVIEPVADFAERGFEVTDLLRALMRRERRYLRQHNARDVLLRDGRRSRPVGSTLRQPVLARTLRRLAEYGVEDFYQGEIARQIHEDMQQNDGLIRDDDLARIPWPIERKPVATRFRSMRLVTFPPPGAGRALIEIMHILEQLPQRLWDPGSPRGAIALAEVIRRAAMDRKDRPYDPAFYPQVSDREMLGREYARKVARRVRKRIRTKGETTHLSVMDRFGNVVALTQSIERVFGACVMTPELGFLYNNYMMAFDYDDISHPYYMRPNAVPWASVAPTIVFRGPRPYLAIGSPGSERIISAIAQVLLRLNFQSPYAAVDAPRLHCSVDGKVALEASRFRTDIPRALERRGFTIDEREPYSFYLGCVQLVMRERSGFIGVADPRRDGSAGGPVA
jgi:gamma-glutamyltranspeptidase/glutathione hydrolase